MDNKSSRRDREEFSDFFEKHHRMLYSFAINYLDQEEDREDCIQNVVVEILKRLDLFLTFSEARKIAYCKKAIHNEAIDLIKRRAKQSQEELIDSIPGDADIAEDYLVKEKNIVLRQCLQLLRPKYRKVIELFYFFGYSASEIAQRMDLTVSSVWTYLAKARAELRELLEKRGYTR